VNRKEITEFCLKYSKDGKNIRSGKHGYVPITEITEVSKGTPQNYFSWGFPNELWFELDNKFFKISHGWKNEFESKEQAEIKEREKKQAEIKERENERNRIQRIAESELQIKKSKLLREASESKKQAINKVEKDYPEPGCTPYFLSLLIFWLSGDLIFEISKTLAVPVGLAAAYCYLKYTNSKYKKDRNKAYKRITLDYENRIKIISEMKAVPKNPSAEAKE